MSFPVFRTALAAVVIAVPSLTLTASPATRNAATRPATNPAKAYEQLVQDTIAFSDRLTDILRGVSDEATANAAVPRLQAAREEVLKLRERTLQLGTGEPSKEAQDVLEKHRERLEAAWKRTAAEQARVRSDPTLEKSVGAHLDALQVFQAVKKQEQ